MIKNVFKILSGFIFAACLIFGAAACDEHTHSYSDWFCNESFHWRVPTCGCDVPAEINDHAVGGEECSVCALPYQPTEGVLYNKYLDFVEVAGYKGTAERIRIASEYEGLPVTHIANSAFDGHKNNHKNLKTVVIPDSVVSIGESAFASCYNLLAVTIPSSVKRIGEYAFESCINLKYVTMMDGVEYIDGFAFKNCDSLSQVTIPDSVTYIGDRAFVQTYENLKFNEKDGLNYLGSEKNPYLYLANPVSLDITEATVDENCRFVGFGAFEGCKKLTTVTIPNGVRRIGNGIFYGCESLTTLQLPFLGNEENENGYCSLISFFERSWDHHVYPIALKSVSVARGVIVDDAFGYYTDSDVYSNGLTSITLGDGVTAIGNRAFGYSKHLKSIVIPKSVKRLDKCDGIETVTLEDPVGWKFVYESGEEYHFTEEELTNMDTLLSYLQSNLFTPWVKE